MFDAGLTRPSQLLGWEGRGAWDSECGHGGDADQAPQGSSQVELADAAAKFQDQLVNAAPQSIRVDNGPELTSIALTRWCAQQHIAIHYIQPGKPQQNAYIERFNRS